MQGISIDTRRVLGFVSEEDHVASLVERLGGKPLKDLQRIVRVEDSAVIRVSKDGCRVVGSCDLPVRWANAIFPHLNESENPLESSLDPRLVDEHAEDESSFASHLDFWPAESI